MRKRLVLPGMRIEDGVDEIASDIRTRMNPLGLTPREVMLWSEPVGTDIFGSEYFSEDCQYHVLYEHVAPPRYRRLHVANRDELVSFLRDRIRPELSMGIDLVVARTAGPERFLMCNHDGEMFLLRPPKLEP